MRITKRNLLTVILAVLCAVAISLGVGFVMPKKNNSKIANAATSSPFTKAELDALAQAAKYSNFGELSYAVKNNETVNASKFGNYTVSFGGMDWFPVLATASSNDIVLTLWLKTSIGTYTFSDGSFGQNATYAPNNYRYSWIRSAINAGQTPAPDNGSYYGSWPNSTTSTAAPTKYANNVKSPSANCAPINFKTFSSIVGNSFIVPGGDYGDYVWLPSAAEAKSGGSWGCTSAQWAGSGNCWTRSSYPSPYYFAYGLNTSGGAGSLGVNDAFGVRPAINVKISDATVSAPTIDQTPKPYTGSTLSFTFSFDSSYIDITSVTGKDFYGNTITSVSVTNNISSGVFKASLAGTYTVTLDLNSAALADDKQWCDTKGGTDKREYTFTISRKGVDVPTVQNTPATFADSPIDFGLSGYDPAIMSVPSGGYYATNGSSISWDNTAGAEKFTATDADTYTVNFHMDDPNYIWKTDSGESADDQSKTITINKKEIAISTTPSVNLSWGLNDTATLTVVPTVSGIANPDYQLEIYYIKDGDTTNHITAGVDLSTNTLDISQVAATGSYTLCVALKASYAGNKNYCIANNLKEIPFTIKAGAIDYSVIDWYYQEDGNTNLNDLYDASGVQNVIRYKMDSTNGNLVNYFIKANIQASTSSYLSIADTYNTAPYSAGIYTYIGTQSYNGGASAVGTYTTRIVLNTDANHAFDDAHKLNNDGTLGWYEITWDIIKGQIDQDYLDNLVTYLNYKVGVSGPIVSYDKNPPEYSGSTVYISLDSLSYRYLGITGVTISGANSGKDPGRYTAMMTFAVDPNYDNPGTVNVVWEIAKQSIDVDWTTDTWTDANGDDYQIRVLNIASNLKQYIQYEYYLADPSDYSMQTKLIGVDGTGLQALIDNYGASLSNALPIYVKATVKDPNGNYRLVDKTGNRYDCAVQYNLGSNNTQANVILSVTTAEYGSTTINAGILSIIDTDDGSELKNNSRFIDRIYITDASGNDLGDWDSFDFNNADKGVYTIKITLTADGDNEYVLIWKNGHTFEILPKAIPLPTLSEIVFSNQFVNLADCLGGSYLEYKNIITLGGMYDGVKNVGSYTATLTLTDSNYCWDYSGLTTVKWLVGYSLADNEFKEVSDIVCELSWGITPYVLKTSSWNLSGKEGAAYNLPANLTDGLEVTINYQYYTDKVSNPLAEGESLVAGSTYFVKAELLGADANNFVFEDSKTTTSDFVTYKVPKSGMAAFMGTMKDFFTKTVLGLPVWLWFVIALALLILLIIIIVVASKRRKNKEEREAKKEAKEEEKRRREAERELAKAKQEAELEKIRAQAGLGMAGMGAASMAMQQPMQQQMPVPQQQPVQQQMPQYQQPVPQYQQMPMAMPQQMPMPQMSGGSGGGLSFAEMMSMMTAQFAGYKADSADKEIASLKNDKEITALRHELEKMQTKLDQLNASGVKPAPEAAVSSAPATDHEYEKIVAVATAVWRNMQAQAQQPQQVQTMPAPQSEAAAVYPPDAVVTTTTTVDTTKNKPNGFVRTEENFDVDGFYDKYE